MDVLPRVSSVARKVAGSAAMLVLFSACPRSPGLEPTPLPVVEGAVPVGSAKCLECHVEVGERYAGKPHAVLMTRHEGCEGCHGPGSKHVESFSSDDIVGVDRLRALDADTRAAICLQCHTRVVPRFPESAHARAQVSCWTCHSQAFHSVPPQDERSAAMLESEPVPVGLRATPLVSTRAGAEQVKLCFQCHGTIAADFLLQFHHPVPEGQMRCTDCHDVHGEAPHVIADRGDERCIACHEEIRGPFVFEHLALEDGCMVCHAPHGSISEKLLTQENNGLCQQCHFDANFPLIGGVDHTGFLSARAFCWDCHFQIHGSNTDENFVPLRIEELRRTRGFP